MPRRSGEAAKAGFCLWFYETGTTLPARAPSGATATLVDRRFN
jgi:hypothetical protein